MKKLHTKYAYAHWAFYLIVCFVVSVLASQINQTYSGFIGASVVEAASPLTSSAVESNVRFYDSIMRTSVILSAVPFADISKASAEKTIAVQQMSLAQKRAEAMQQLAKTDPQAFLRNVISPAAYSKLPPAVQAQVERKINLTGMVEVLHIDDFETHKNSRFEYYLQANGARYSLYFAGDPPAMRSSSKISITGYQLGQIIVANASAADLKILSTPTLDSVGPQRLLAILVTGPGQPGAPSQEEMRSKIFANSFQRFYGEQSYDKVSFTGSVVNWISVSNYPADVCGQVDLDTPEIDESIFNSDIDLSLYDRIVFVINNQGGGCATVGKYPRKFHGKQYLVSKGWVGWLNSDPVLTNKMTLFQYIFSHEMGHGLGVMHANAWYCSGPSLDSDCSHAEYGNGFDVMGTGSYAVHFNAFYKDLLGWLAPADKVFVTQTGHYLLAPLEATSGIRAAIVQNPAFADNLLVGPLYLEYRQPIGFDAIISSKSAGIHINKVMPGFQPFSRLLNANYATDFSPPWLPWQPALMPGSSFIYPSRGITINSDPNTHIGDSASFGVRIDPVTCQRGDLNWQAPFELPVVIAGASGAIVSKFSSGDSPICAPNTISMSATISDEIWDITYSPSQQFELKPAEEVEGVIAFSVPIDTPAGNYRIFVTVGKSTDNNRLYQKQFDITVKAPPVITAIKPVTGKAGDTVTLIGTGFGSSNNIYIFNQEDPYLNRSLLNLTASNSKLSFTFPTTMQDIVSGSTVPTRDGTYYITLTNLDGYGTSKPYPFIVESEPLLPVSGANISISLNINPKVYQLGQTLQSTGSITNSSSRAVTASFKIEIFKDNAKVGEKVIESVHIPPGSSPISAAAIIQAVFNVASISNNPDLVGNWKMRLTQVENPFVTVEDTFQVVLSLRP